MREGEKPEKKDLEKDGFFVRSRVDNNGCYYNGYFRCVD